MEDWKIKINLTHAENYEIFQHSISFEKKITKEKLTDSTSRSRSNIRKNQVGFTEEVLVAARRHPAIRRPRPGGRRLPRRILRRRVVGRQVVHRRVVGRRLLHRRRRLRRRLARPSDRRGSRAASRWRRAATSPAAVSVPAASPPGRCRIRCCADNHKNWRLGQIRQRKHQIKEELHSELSKCDQLVRGVTTHQLGNLVYKSKRNSMGTLSNEFYSIVLEILFEKNPITIRDAGSQHKYEKIFWLENQNDFVHGVKTHQLGHPGAKPVKEKPGTNKKQTIFNVRRRQRKKARYN